MLTYADDPQVLATRRLPEDVVLHVDAEDARLVVGNIC
jgi:hypothetical protein